MHSSATFPKYAVEPKRARRRSRKAASASRKICEAIYILKGDLARITFIVFLALSSAGALVFTLAFLLMLHPSYIPEIIGHSFPESTFSLFDNSKNEFISRMGRHKEKEFTAHVHFVSEIIRESDRRAKEVKNLASMIVKESYYANYDPLFVAAVIKSESLFKNKAKSHVGARGLMQLMPDTARFMSRTINIPWEGNAKLEDPQYNLRLGIAYLKHLETLYRGNRERILMAYNWGPGNLAEGLKGKKIVPSVTRQYTRNIMRDHARWRDTFEVRKHEFRRNDSPFLAVRGDLPGQSKTL